VRDETVRALKAVGHPDRVRVLEAFAEGPRRSAVHVSPLVGLPVQNVSYHANELLRARLLVPAGVRPVRGATQRFYEASDLGKAALLAARRLDRQAATLAADQAG
jgi:DNA-binding transcriptional ArsR family regulator